MWGLLRGLGLGCVGICSLWFAGLIWFANPPVDESSPAPTDAIVVLTGGSLRLQSGIDLLREGKGQKLFVSGVNRQVDLEDLLGSPGNVPDWAICCIVIGHQAGNTFGNAQETARWIRSQGFRSLRLVTAWYHMPRSVLEFHRVLPEIDIVAHPVFPDQVIRKHWWAQRGTASLLVVEYVKYLGAMSRPLLEWRKPTVAGPSEAARAERRT